MTPGMWKPKRWNTPRAHNRDVTYFVDYIELLKDVYTGELEKPAWAKLARKRGWISFRDYFESVPWEPSTVNRLDRLMYADNPLFKLLPKGEA